MSNRKRRGRGEGSVYQRADGVWIGSLSMGYDAEGKRQRYVVAGRTKAEAQQKLRKLQDEADKGQLTRPLDLKLGELLERWLEDVVRVEKRRNTYRCYRDVTDNHIKKHLGGVVVTSLTALHVRRLLGDMERAGASPRMRQLARVVLGVALKWVMEELKAITHNVCKDVKGVRVPEKEMRCYTPEQVRQFFETSAGHRLEALFVLAVATGLREGELFGLQWPDLDLAGAVLHVQRQLEEVWGQLALTEPKTKAGKRRVELPAFAVEALWQHKARMLAEGHLEGPVFCDTEGGWLRKSNFTRQVFKPLLKKAGLPDIRFHDLRHTAATLLLKQNVHPKVVQERLGHSKIQVTLDLYTHALPSLQKEAASKLDDLLGQSG